MEIFSATRKFAPIAISSLACKPIFKGFCAHTISLPKENRKIFLWTINGKHWQQSINTAKMVLSIHSLIYCTLSNNFILFNCNYAYPRTIYFSHRSYHRQYWLYKWCNMYLFLLYRYQLYFDFRRTHHGIILFKMYFFIMSINLQHKMFCLERCHQVFLFGKQ